MIGRALQSERTEGDLLLPLPHESSLSLQDLIDRAIDVRRYKQIEVAVLIRIEERRSRVPSRRFDSDLRRHVLERSIAAIAIQDVRPEVGDKEIGFAVGV